MTSLLALGHEVKLAHVMLKVERGCANLNPPSWHTTVRLMARFRPRRPVSVGCCRRLPSRRSVNARLLQVATADFSFGVISRSLRPTEDTHKTVGQELVRNQGVSTRRWASSSTPLGPPAAPRSSAGSAWGREAPSYRVWPAWRHSRGLGDGEAMY